MNQAQASEKGPELCALDQSKQTINLEPPTDIQDCLSTSIIFLLFGAVNMEAEIQAQIPAVDHVISEYAVVSLSPSELLEVGGQRTHVEEGGVTDMISPAGRLDMLWVMFADSTFFAGLSHPCL